MPETARSPQNGAEAVSAVRRRDVMVNASDLQVWQRFCRRTPACPLTSPCMSDSIARFTGMPDNLQGAFNAINENDLRRSD